MILNNIFQQVLGDGEVATSILREALADRNKEECNMKLGSFVRAHIKDMIRESGDRGTSILNFLTNFTLFLAALSLVRWHASEENQ